MRFLVFQHIAIEHPGIFREFFAQDGIEWDAVELDTGDRIPSLENYDALWVMGGPMEVWEEDQHAWLIAEKCAIREAVVDRAMPFIGICLGHQLLGAALGGVVGRAEEGEIGLLEIALTAAGRADPLFSGVALHSKVLQWHGTEVSKMPLGGVVLAESPLCKIQAMRVGQYAYGLQYHPDVTTSTVPQWGVDPAVSCAVNEILGDGVLPQLETEVSKHMAQLHRDSRRIFDNFITLVRSR